MKQWDSVKKQIRPFLSHHISTYSACACFYILLSLLPGTLLLISLLSAIPSTVRLLELLEQLLPAQLVSILIAFLRYIQDHNSIGLMSLSAIFALWSASKGIYAMTDGLNAVLDHKKRKPFLLRRLSAMVTLLLVILVLLALLVVYTLGERFLLLLSAPTASAHSQQPGISYLYAAGLLTAIFSFLYYTLPEERIPFRFCLLGSAVTTAGWYAWSWLFSIYVNYFASYHLIYGSLGVLVLGMIWLQLCLRMVLYGGLLCGLCHRDEFHPIRLWRAVFRQEK